MFQSSNKRRKINPPSNSPPSPLPTSLTPSLFTPSPHFTTGFEAEEVRRSEVEVEVRRSEVEVKGEVEVEVELFPKEEASVEKLGRGKRIRRRPSYLQDYVVTYHA